jgi:ribosomal protein L3
MGTADTGGRAPGSQGRSPLRVVAHAEQAGQGGTIVTTTFVKQVYEVRRTRRRCYTNDTVSKT